MFVMQQQQQHQLPKKKMHYENKIKKKTKKQIVNKIFFETDIYIYNDCLKKKNYFFP